MSGEESLTNKKFWDEYYINFQPTKIEKILFSDIFNKFLTPDASKSILEIGCAGGAFLCYFAKYFHYQAYGVDFSDKISETYAMFNYNKLSRPTLFHEDFFSWKAPKTFDIVCSFGFVEHFDNLTEVLQEHVKHLSTDGTLIISMPHFSHLQYFFHYLVDRENLKKHNTKIMNLIVLKNACNDLSLEIIYLSYYRTFGFWIENKSLLWWQKIAYNAIIFTGRVINKIFGLQKPNFLVSPHIICIAKKKQKLFSQASIDKKT